MAKSEKDNNQQDLNKIDDNELKNDFYKAINGKWIENTKIPADHSSTGGFNDLADDVDKTLMKDSDNFIKNSDNLPEDNKELAEYANLYKMTSDFEKRNKDGNRPIQPYLERIERLHSYKDLSSQLTNWIQTGLPLPFAVTVDPDMKNTSKYTLFAEAPSLFLPDKTYYTTNKEAAKLLMPKFTEMAEKVLELAGYSPLNAERITEEAKAFDKLIAPYVKSSEEAADFAKLYNPQSINEFAKSTDELKLKPTIEKLVNGKPESIIVTEPNYFKHLNEILTPKNFDLLKSWIILKTVLSMSGSLSEDFRLATFPYSQALSGIKEPIKQKKAAYYLASGVFDQVVGNYYGKKYFGEKAKNDVTEMVKKMIKVYEERLKQNKWLGEATRKKAIEKLNHLQIHVGYPDKLDPLYKKLHVTPSKNRGTVLSNVMDFTKIANKDHFSKWNKEVPRDEWEMSASTVNAYFDPFKNVIVFPAAILQKPFYSLEQSRSSNYGGIGAVIAHEISHAFDNNGALFDEYGNLNNWWTKADQEHFEKLGKKMVAEFNDQKFAGEKVNGKLTLSENIADAGGLSAAEEAAKNDVNPNLKEFFLNWGKIWRTKSTDEYKKLLLAIDVHAPAPLRAQVQVKNLDDFYTTFNISSKDKMYLSPKERVKIW